MAHGLVKSGKSIQVVVGMTVPQVREHLNKWLRISYRPKINNTKKDTSLYAIIVNDHRIDVSFIMIYESSPYR